MFTPRHTPIALILGSLIATSSFAEEAAEQNNSDDIVISANRVESKRVETGSAITVLDEAYLKENQARTVAELLQDVPGVSVASNGGLGKKTSFFIRGADSEKTLVIIDGVEVNDLGNYEGGYDFAYLMADNIERIEVLRGSQSALWGSDAMGGVINIVTKKGKAGFTPSMGLEVGGNNYSKGSVSFSGAQGDSHFSLSASQLNTDGFSARDNEEDDDGYKNKTVALKAGHQFSSIFAIDAALRYNDAKSEYDNTSGTDNDSGDYNTNVQRLAKLNTNLNLLNNQLKNRLSIAFSDSKNEDISTWGGEYEGQKIKTDLQSDYYLNTINTYSQRISFIAEHENDKYQSLSMAQNERIEASGIVLGYAADLQKVVFVNAAVRHDFNSKFDDTTTYHIDISGWVSDGTRVHASHGTGVMNPNLGQLYGENTNWGYSGNADLEPEESLSWDTGVEYNFADVNAYIDLTYFDSRYTNMITWTGSYPNSTYSNLDDKATMRGIEFTGSLKITEDFRANSSYTYMKTDDGEGNELDLRAKHSASINANYKYTPNLSANIGARYVGERLDGDETLDNYTVITIGTAWQVHKHITLSARLENAFDEDYEEVYGYNTTERTAYVGVTFH